MVYTIQRFRVIPNPLDTPISVGEDELPSPTGIDFPTPGYGYPYPYPPLTFGTPSTGTGTGTISETPPTLPGLLEVGDITKVDVPDTTKRGETKVIRTWFKNKTNSPMLFFVTLSIADLSINLTSPNLSVQPDQTAAIETQITVPTTAINKTYSGLVELDGRSAVGTSFKQDTESFSLVVSDAAPVGVATISTDKHDYTLGATIQVTGSGYMPGEKVKLYLSKDGTTRNTASDMTANVTGAVTGTIVANVVLTNVNVRGDGRTSGRKGVKGINIGAISGTAVITPSASSVKPGGTFSINCTGFAAGEKINFIAKVGTTTVATDAKNAGTNGAVTLDTMDVIAGAPLGTATITATGALSARVATATIQIVASTTTSASITLSATSVPKGGTFSINCVGFAPSEVINFKAVIGTLTVGTDAKPAGTNGAVTLITMNISATSPLGLATVTAKGATSGRTATKTIQVTAASTSLATISTAKSSYTRGETISISGTGFQSGEPVHPYVTVGSVERATGPNANASTSGTVSTTCPTGNTLGGGHVHLKGLTSGRHAEKSIAVVASTSTANIVAQTATAPQGGSFKVNATGFAGGEIVDFVAKIGSTTIHADTKTMSASGGAIDTMLVPSNAPTGTATITAVGRVSHRSGTATITIVAQSPIVRAGPAVITPNKTTYKKGEAISLIGTGLYGFEKARLSVTIGGALASALPDKLTDSSGKVTGTLSSNLLGGGHVRLKGRTSLREAEFSIKVVA